MSHTLPGSRLLLAALLVAAAPPSFALGLGEADLRSALGEPLDLVITITAGPEDSLGADCFYLPRPLPGGLPAVTRAQFTIESGPKLRVRTPQPLNEPAMMLRMHASCPGGGLVAREYPLLLDPRPVTAVAAPVPAPPVQAPRAAAANSASDPGAPGLRSIAGDTLAGLAGAVYPKNRRAREAYVAALREANPALAGLGPDEPIPPETAVILPDLRAVANRSKSTAAAGAAPATEPPQPPRQVKRERPAPESAVAPRERKSPPARPRESARRVDGFVLRLSSGEVDLARSRDIDDRTRAQLRERLTLLDADDQVSALLQMRNSLRQLENRVAEMQLRLSGSMPVTPVTAPAAAPPKPAVPEAVAPAAPPAPAQAPPVEPPPAAAPPKPAPAPSVPDPPKAAAAAKPEPAPVPMLSLQAWGLIALAAAGLALFAFLVIRRRNRPSARRRSAEREREFIAATVMNEQGPSSQILDPEGMSEPVEAAPARAQVDSDAGLATRVPGADPQVLRRRYLEERFPEIANGALDIANPDSVVKGARLLYEDGALPRAVELLQFALEENPAQMKPWLALFEIFRLENLAGEFSVLAARFREHHGTTDNWRKVQYIGREIDPQNPLYRDDAFDSLETIGYPNAAKARAITFDPLAENWLNAPMDFTSDALAGDLRRALLADAGIAESDLIPNPMPALKQVEMFTVA